MKIKVRDITSKHYGSWFSCSSDRWGHASGILTEVRKCEPTPELALSLGMGDWLITGDGGDFDFFAYGDTELDIEETESKK